MSSNMTTEEVYEALNLQLQQQEIENRLARMELRNELTENNRVVSDMAQAIDRWIGSSEPTTPVFNRLLARFTNATPAVARAPAPAAATAPISTSLPMHTTSTTPAVVRTPAPEASAHTAVVPPPVPSIVQPQAPDHDTTSPTRIRRSEKIVWPKCQSTEDPIIVKGWRMKFLASINTCDLDFLYDPSTNDLFRSHHDTNALKVLYGIIQVSLPDGHPLILNRSYWGTGLLLWHAFSATVIPALTFHKRQELIQTLFHHTTRSTSEDIHTYYNRLATDADDINSGSYPPFVSHDDLRRRFLFSLGPEFEFMKTDDIEGRLDPTYLTSEIEPLLYRLQSILHTKRGGALVPTMSSSGYVNAVTMDRSATEHRLDTLTEMIGDLVAQSRLPAPSFAAAVVPSTIVPHPPPDTEFYCWSHGVCKHHSFQCSRPLPGHQTKATLHRRLGGSSYVKTYKE